MSDEYTSSQVKASLVNKSAQGQGPAPGNTSYETRNYPPPDDTTSSGGYGARAQDAWSNTAQRGHPDVRGSPRTNLVDQSPSGGPLGQEMQDVQQGQDDRARRQFAHEAGRDFGQGAQGLNPYGRNVDSKAEAAGFLASGYSDQRMNQFESAAAKGNDEDVGAF